MESARPAFATDVDALAGLARLAEAELAPMRGGGIWSAREARQEPLEAGFTQDLADPAARVLVGTIDEVVIGYAVARIERLNDGTDLGVVVDIFVDEGARGVGVGDVMMADLVAWCRHGGCVGIDAMALPGHRASKNFFEQHGFTARKLVMHHRLATEHVEPGHPEPA